MRSMPQIPVTEKTPKMTSTFRGYNHNEIIADGEMFDTKNLSDDLYPSLSPRKRRGITSYDVSGQDPVPLTGIHGREKLVHIRGTEVFYDFEKVTGISVSAAEAKLPKKIVNMGAYTCIWPDKVYFNTVDPTDCGSMERLYEKSGSDISLMMCRMDGTDYDMTAITVSATPPDSPAHGDLWIDQSGDVDVLRQYYAPANDWQEVASVYVKIGGTGSGAGSGLSENDAVMISGFEYDLPAEPTDKDYRLQDQVATLNGSYTVIGAGEDYLIVTGLISATIEALKNVTVHIDRKVPDLDFIVESNNRLWGCRYGMDDDQVVNEIRASKLGDFRNWSTFMGISTDSYTASIGTDGEFTGAISQRGYPVFMKDDVIHKVSGMTPSSFQITTIRCPGVQKGSWRSLVNLNEMIYYKSRQGVMLYDGNTVQSISDQLGKVSYSDARAGAIGDKYYISMKNANAEWSLFTYNTKTGIWYREDGLKALGFGAVGDELFIIDEENNTLVTVGGSKGTLEDEVDWMAEFGLSGIEMTPTQGGYARSDINGSHYLSRFVIRIYLEESGKAELDIMYDSCGEWIRMGEIRGNRMRSIMLPVVPRRCDHLRFRLKGRGEFRIYSICRYMEVGSDA